MNEARIHPPSEERAHLARRAGHVPRAPLVALFAGCAALVAWLGFAAGPLHGALRALYAEPLARVARGEPLALAALTPHLGAIARSLGAGLALAFACVALGTFVAQGPAVGFSRPRFASPRLSPGRLAPALCVLALILVIAPLAPRLLRATLDDVRPLLFACALRIAVALGMCALIDASFARAAHLRSLWLTRREQRDEQREAHGTPEMRRARAEARRTEGAP